MMDGIRVSLQEKSKLQPYKQDSMMGGGISELGCWRKAESHVEGREKIENQVKKPNKDMTGRS
jgi:hypothetical protein